jgi:hypothetical protein
MAKQKNSIVFSRVRDATRIQNPRVVWIHLSRGDFKIRSSRLKRWILVGRTAYDQLEKLETEPFRQHSKAHRGDSYFPSAAALCEFSDMQSLISILANPLITEITTKHGGIRLASSIG